MKKRKEEKVCDIIDIAAKADSEALAIMEKIVL